MNSLAGIGIVGVIATFVCIILVILWFFLPFMINGINTRLSRIIRQNEQIISHLERLGPYFNK